MPSSVYFYPRLVLRTPAYPYESQFNKADIRALLFDEDFMNALYLASPTLQGECLKWREGSLQDPKRIEKLCASVTRYYSRAFSRCTPFGLFAGCSVVNWGDENRIQVRNGQVRQHTRLDMQYLCGLSACVARLPPVRERLLYFSNTGTYQIGDEIRYIESQHTNAAQQLYQISSVHASEYLLRILSESKGGVKLPEIARRLADALPDLTPEDARNFVDQLVDAQLLVSELEPGVIGKEYMYQLLDVLERVQAQEPVHEIAVLTSALRAVEARLRALDSGTGDKAALYEQIVQLLLPLGAPLERDRLFQVDATMPVAAASLDRALQSQLLEALEILNHLAPSPFNERLENFKQQFSERYGNREIPLLEVLDAENGICYANHERNGHSSLTEDLILPDVKPEEKVVPYGDLQQLIDAKLREAERNGSYAIEIAKAEISGIDRQKLPLPPSFPILFRLVDNDTILCESMGGSSAVNLLGRFAHGNQEIHEIIRDITQTEQKNNPEVVLAEINHLPESRTGNILSRPLFRNYEIPYLTKACSPLPAQISVQDLYVSVKNDRVWLRSRKLNKFIMPRLGTAHNYTYRSMPVYHFLCDLQTQGLKSSLYFDWRPVFSHIKFLPRVTFGKVILHLATWQLTRKDLQPLLDDQAGSLAERLEVLRSTWRLPRFFTFAEGDNELLVDVHNPLTVTAWLEIIKRQEVITLKEFLFDPRESCVTDADGRPYVNQFIGMVLRKIPSYPAGSPAPAPRIQGNKQREFHFGSEWLYYKLYCGIKSSDRILTEAIGPLVDELQSNGLIDKWFFIRYADPETHLRVRFHLKDTAAIGKVVLMINLYLEPYITGKYIWKIQTDTYQRELERYGNHAIEQTENLFFHDSVATLGLLHETVGNEQEPLRWLWGTKSVDELFNAFGLPLADKLRLVSKLKEAFGQEFGEDKNLKVQLDSKYRNYKTIMNQVLDQQTEPGGEVLPGFEHILHRNRQISGAVREIRRLEKQKRLGVTIEQLLASHTHMILNRLIPANQRLHEMVIYNFLFRKYQSLAVLSKKQRPSPDYR